MKADVTYHDPHVPTLNAGGLRMVSQPLSEQMIEEQDCVVITTNHSVFDMPTIVEAAKLVVDSRNATKGISCRKIVKL
jgi:UDP-N-acetyl-D-glucosamine dehydrogenase